MSTLLHRHLGMMGVVRGSAKWLGNNQTVNAPPDSPVSHLMAARVNPTGISAAAPGRLDSPGPGRAGWQFFSANGVRRHVFAIGANENVASLQSGVRVGLVKAATYAISGL